MMVTSSEEDTQPNPVNSALGVAYIYAFSGEGAELVGCEPGAAGSHLSRYLERTCCMRHLKNETNMMHERQKSTTVPGSAGPAASSFLFSLPNPV